MVFCEDNRKASKCRPHKPCLQTWKAASQMGGVPRHYLAHVSHFSEAPESRPMEIPRDTTYHPATHLRQTSSVLFDAAVSSEIILAFATRLGCGDEPPQTQRIILMISWMKSAMILHVVGPNMLLERTSRGNLLARTFFYFQTGYKVSGNSQRSETC